MENLFETAIRSKYRFDTIRGSVTVEDLWDMPLESKDGFNLDVLAVSLSDKTEHVKSFVSPKNPENTVNKAKLDIVVYVIETKLKEIKEREDRASNKERKEKLLGILQQKQDEELTRLTEAEIKEEISRLEQ